MTRKQHNRKPCEQEGCTYGGIPCYYHMSDDAPAAWYCEEHSHDAGFCPGCGMYSAGFESFDFSPTGYCAACQAELDSEFDDGDWEEDEDGGLMLPEYYDDDQYADDALDW